MKNAAGSSAINAAAKAAGVDGTAIAAVRRAAIAVDAARVGVTDPAVKAADNHALRAAMPELRDSRR